MIPDRAGGDFPVIPSSDNASHSGCRFLRTVGSPSFKRNGCLCHGSLPHPSSDDETEACFKTLEFRLYGIFGEKGRIHPHRCRFSSCGSISDETGIHARQRRVARCRMRMTAPLRCTPEQEKEGDRAHAGGRRHLS